MKLFILISTNLQNLLECGHSFAHFDLYASSYIVLTSLQYQLVVGARVQMVQVTRGVGSCYLVTLSGPLRSDSKIILAID